MFPRDFSKMIVAGALICFCIGCKSTAPRGEEAGIQHSGAHYAYLFGQRYRTKSDLYIFMFTHEPDYLYIGGNGFGPKELPHDVTKKNIGQTYERVTMDSLGDLEIFNVAPADSILTVYSETHDVTWLSGVRGSGGYPMGFICQLNHEGQTNYVYSEFIQSHKKVSGKMPNEFLNPALVEKIQ